MEKRRGGLPESPYASLLTPYSLPHGMIKLVDVHKTFGKQHVLRGVTLEIPKGKLTTIIGRSGEGKSVLLKHMIGLLQPDRGEVWVEGTEISRLHSKALNDVRKRFAMLFQGAALFDSLSVFDNVAFPLREKLRTPEPEVTRRVEEKTRAGGAGRHGAQVPGRVVRGHEKAGRSGARAGDGTGDHPVRRTDDGLDPLMANTIHKLILAMHRMFGFTAIMVSHEIPEIFGISDWVAMLEQGKIAAMAPSEEFQRINDPSIQEFITVGGTVTAKR